MICKYCGSPLKAGETVCVKCKKQQDSMVQMEGFNEEQYIEKGSLTEAKNMQDGGRKGSAGGWTLPEQEWNRFTYSVHEERRKGRVYRKKTALCLLAVILVNIALLLACIWLNFRIGSLEKSVEKYKDVWEEQQTDENSAEDEEKDEKNEGNVTPGKEEHVTEDETDGEDGATPDEDKNADEKALDNAFGNETDGSGQERENDVPQNGRSGGESQNGLPENNQDGSGDDSAAQQI